MEGTDAVKEFLTGTGLAADPNVEKQETTSTEQTQQTVQQTQETVQTGTENQQTQQTKETADTGTAEAKPIELSDDQRLFAINQHFGTAYTSLAEAGKVKEEWSEVSNLREYKSKYEELEAAPRFKAATPGIDELNRFALATGIDDTGIIKQIRRFENAAEKDPIEAIVLSKVIEKPSLAEDIDTLRLRVQRQYANLKINTEDLEGEELQRAQEDMKLAQFSLKQDADDAIAKISEVTGKAKSYVPPQEAAIQSTKAQQEANQAQWKATLSNKAIRDLFSSIPVQVSLGKDEQGNPIIENAPPITLTPQEVDEAIDTVSKYFAGNNLTPDAETVNSAVSQQLDIIRALRWQETTAKVVEAKVAKAILERDKAAHNPSGVLIDTPNTPNTGQNKPVDILAAIDQWQKR